MKLAEVDQNAAAAKDSNKLERVYFDNHATTPCDPRVLQTMLPYFSADFGNAESVQHPFGWKAKLAVDQARSDLAALIGAEPNEIVFTSGATESIHLALLGYAQSQADRRVITAATEHKASLAAAKEVERRGGAVTVLPVDRYGQVSADQVEQALRPNTALVSLMHGNNEVGTLHPIAAIGALLKNRGIAFHVDAAQTVGKESIDVNAMGISLLSLSGHKMYAPKGVGALYVRRGLALSPLFLGGAHERGLRAGTLNVPGIVGLGEAARIAREEMMAESEKLRRWRDRIIASVANLDGVRLNGHPTDRLPNNVNLSLDSVDGDKLMRELHGFAYSSASACSGGSPSHVIDALMDAPGAQPFIDDTFTSTLRIGLGRFNTEAEVENLVAILPKAILEARAALAKPLGSI